MNAEQQKICCVCGAPPEEEISIPTWNPICSNCLTHGKFPPGSTARLTILAEQLLSQSSQVQKWLQEICERSNRLTHQREFDLARRELMISAQSFISDSRPMVAAILLFEALKLPGQSAEVYQLLGQLAQSLDYVKEAVQFYKTSAWLALQSQNQALAQSALETLSELAEEDPWILKAKTELQSKNLNPSQRCSFCGRLASETGPLIAGTQAAICSGCVKKLMSLDGTIH